MKDDQKDQNSINQSQEHRAIPSSETKPTPELKAALPRPAPMKRILVCDMDGSGHRILWTLDGQTWITIGKNRSLNLAERDGYLARFEREQPQADVRKIEDFFCRIPADWCVEGARVI